MNKRQLLGGFALAAVLALSGCGQDKPAFRGVDITGAEYAQGWELADQNGQVRTLKDSARWYQGFLGQQAAAHLASAA